MQLDPLARPCGSFGGRFVDELIRVSGTRTHFRYKLIQDLRRADREKTIVLLRRCTFLEYRWIARIREADEPESVAREMWATTQSGRLPVFAWSWPLSLMSF